VVEPSQAKTPPIGCPATMTKTPNDQCKTCKSPHLHDYERWYFVEKLSPRKMSARAMQEFQENIGKDSFFNHFKYHSQVPAEVQKRYQEQQASIKETAGKVVDELAVLDQLIQDEMETHGLVKAWVSELFRPRVPHIDKSTELPYIPMSLVSMDQGTIAEIRQLIKTKSDLMNGDLKGTEAKMITEAMKKVHEHRKQRLNGPGGGLRGAGFGGKK